MSRTWSHPNFFQAELIIEELMRRGAQIFFVAPGSRSSPLAVAISRVAGEKEIVHFDERGLAFAAIGYVRATRSPSVLVCTSGTAVANFLPAVVEASMSAIPLVILTADRPPELRDRGANQTISQRGIFGDFVRWEAELEAPSTELQPSAIIRVVATAIQCATSSPSGPVHINCPYREPLAPTDKKYSFPEYLEAVNTVVIDTPALGLSEVSISEIKWLKERMHSVKSGLLVVGRLDSAGDSSAVAEFASATGWPVFADVTSQLRLNERCTTLCEHLDLLLLNDKVANAIAPEMVVHIGGEFVSKRLLEHFERYRPAEYVHISNDPRRRDPAGCVTRQIAMDLSSLPRSLELTEQAHYGALQFAQLNLKVSKQIASHFDNEQNLTEIGVARAIVAKAPAHSALFLASSLSIRLVDMYAPVVDRSILVGANRGASGIDGTIASAIGFARGCQRPTTLLIGDLAFLHDLNSLAMVREAGAPIVIVLINNNGGGIFHMLPIAEHNSQFEKFWGTPHGLNFGDITATFGLNYSRPENMTAFHSAFASAHASSGPTLIEVCTSREETAELIRHLQSEIRSLLD